MTTNSTDHETLDIATTQAATARCLARVLVGASDACVQSSCPLTQLQQAAIFGAALLEFDGFGAHLSTLATASRLLADLSPPEALR